MAPCGSTTPGEQVEIQESLDRVQQALDVLTVEKRAVFVLYELEGESCDAIAEALGVPVGTVYSRLHTARREFAKAHAALVARARRLDNASMAREPVRPDGARVV